MVVTGDLVLNLRGMNINGYDCFVNTSNQAWKYGNTYYPFHSSTHGVTTPNPNFPVINEVATDYTKVSPCCLKLSNWYEIYIYNNLVTNKYTTFTLYFWTKYSPFYSSNPTNSEWTHAGSVFIAYSNATIFGRGYKNSIGVKNASSNAQDFTWSKGNVNTWHNFAIVVSGNNKKIFYDGTKIVDYNTSFSDNISQLILNCFYETIWYDDIVLVGNQALWSSNFTPPSTYLIDDSQTIPVDKIKRRNIVHANVDKKLIIPDDDTMKQY